MQVIYGKNIGLTRGFFYCQKHLTFLKSFKWISLAYSLGDTQQLHAIRQALGLMRANILGFCDHWQQRSSKLVKSQNFLKSCFQFSTLTFFSICFSGNKILVSTRPHHYHPQNNKFYYSLCPMLRIEGVNKVIVN